jgi:hypothetical protein
MTIFQKAKKHNGTPDFLQISSQQLAARQNERMM